MNALRKNSFLSGWRLWLALCLFAFTAHTHTLPISYLRVSAGAEYVHVELVFNPFELRFIAEVDENRDGELDAKELKKHGPNIARRLADALKFTIDGRALRAESAGMDPDMTGHHVKLRAHYPADARRSPLTLESDLAVLTSASHLVQVTFLCDGQSELAQLDSHSKKVTFRKHLPARPPPAPTKSPSTQKPANPKSNEPSNR
jgi:hypothetical protein